MKNSRKKVNIGKIEWKRVEYALENIEVILANLSRFMSCLRDRIYGEFANTLFLTLLKL